MKTRSLIIAAGVLLAAPAGALAQPAAATYADSGARRVGTPPFCTTTTGVWTRIAAVTDGGRFAFWAKRTMWYCTTGALIRDYRTALTFSRPAWSTWRVAAQSSAIIAAKTTTRSEDDLVEVRNASGQVRCLEVAQRVDAAGWVAWRVSARRGGCGA